MNSVYDWARFWNSEGVSIVPSKDKKPLVMWTEYKNKLASFAELEKWFVEDKNESYSVITGQYSNLIVVDFDSPTYIPWAISELKPPIMKVKTKRGQHWYYRCCNEEVKSKNGILPTVDIKGEGGLIVGPGSIHKDGGFYEVLES